MLAVRMKVIEYRKETGVYVSALRDSLEIDVNALHPLVCITLSLIEIV